MAYLRYKDFIIQSKSSNYLEMKMCLKFNDKKFVRKLFRSKSSFVKSIPGADSMNLRFVPKKFSDNFFAENFE
jgi:hypothetical protein